MEKNLQIKIQNFFSPKNQNKHKISDNIFFGSKHANVDLRVICNTKYL